MQVKLVSHTQPLEDGYNLEDLIVYCARVSNPKNQNNLKTAPRLIEYLIKHKHWSPFELADVTFEIKTSRAIAAQILRHRSFSFQEFCVSGDTEIYFDLPNAVKNSKRKLYKKKISEIYNMWTKNGNSRNRISNMLVRIYDEESKKIINSKIKEVFKTGIKPIFEIELFNGRKIRCTKEHKILTNSGFESIEKSLGLSLNKNTASIQNKDVYIGCNGIPCHQSYDWMLSTKQKCIKNKSGVLGIAKEAGVSYHTIRKWLKKHNLQFTKKEVSEYTETWNKGKFGYKTKGHSIETIKKMRESARKGKDSNLWKGGSNRDERLKIADWCNSIRSEKLKESDYSCVICESNEKLELDHIKPVYSHPDLAYDSDNIQVLCHDCHTEKHNLSGDRKVWREKSKGNQLTVSWSKVKSVKYIGEEMTYDMEIDHNSHNYVANGIVTHNSQRYAEATEFEPVELRLQGETNRQVGNEVVDPIIGNVEASFLIEDHIRKSNQLYQDLINVGVAKESARMILPLTTQSTLYMKGSVRSWIHYIEIRATEDTQKEHREIAQEIKNNLKNLLPNISKALNW
jgi:thymidylate synthase (FAD)